MVETFMDKVNIAAEGGHLLQVSIRGKLMKIHALVSVILSVFVLYFL